MQIKYTDLSKRFSPFRAEYHQALDDVLETGAFIGGGQHKSFEKELADYLGVRHVLGVGNGTDALYLTLKYLNLDASAQVITVPNSYLASTSSIHLAGLEPVFADISPVDLGICPDSIRRVISDRTKVLMAVHLSGIPNDLNALMQICEEYGLILIEDFSQAVGSGFQNRKVGTFGFAGCASMHPLKNLAALGDAGFVSTNDTQFAAWLEKARNHGHSSRDECDFWSHNMRLDTLQSKFLSVNLAYLDKTIAQRNELAAEYYSILQDVKEVQMPFVRSDDCAGFHTFVIQCKARDNLRDFLLAKGIETKIHYPKLITQLNAFNGNPSNDLSNANSAQHSILSLPISEEHTREEVRFVAHSIREFYKLG